MSNNSLSNTLTTQQCHLISLPPELRHRIYHTTLENWQIPIDSWCNSLSATLALRKFRPEGSRFVHPILVATSTPLSLFHLNRQIRAEACPVISATTTLQFQRGPRSAWDPRWRTAGRPLPPLLAENVARVVVRARDCKDSFSLPMRELPRLEEVIFLVREGLCFEFDGDLEGGCVQDWTWWLDVLPPNVEARLIESCQREMACISWMRHLCENQDENRADLPFQAVVRGSVIFPDINFEAKTVKMALFTFVCDFKKKEMRERKIHRIDQHWPEDDTRRWTVPVNELWKIGNNAMLEKYRLRP